MIASLSLSLGNLEKKPTTAFTQKAEVGVKWNVNVVPKPCVDLKGLAGRDVVEHNTHRNSGLDPGKKFSVTLAPRAGTVPEFSCFHDSFRPLFIATPNASRSTFRSPMWLQSMRINRALSA